ncbi:hypothetical protein U1Q18_044783 [Sarracenia purpurea var. burkii]
MASHTGEGERSAAASKDGWPVSSPAAQPTSSSSMLLPHPSSPPASSPTSPAFAPARADIMALKRSIQARREQNISTATIQSNEERCSEVQIWQPDEHSNFLIIISIPTATTGIPRRTVSPQH